MRRYKIPREKLITSPLLELVSKFKKEVLLSTGMSNYNEIETAFKILKKIL